MATIIGAAIITISLSITTPAAAGCKPGDPTGFFEGTANSKQAGR